MEDYRQLMISKPTMPEQLEQGALLTPGVLGGPAFLARLPRRVRSRFQSADHRIRLDLLLQGVANLYALRIDEILSRRRERRLVLARTLIAWYATEYGGATLSEVARFLHRDVSTLSRTVGRYRRCDPEIFGSQILAALRIPGTICPVEFRS
jgi:hypothetical protein